MKHVLFIMGMEAKVVSHITICTPGHWFTTITNSHGKIYTDLKTKAADCPAAHLTTNQGPC